MVSVASGLCRTTIFLLAFYLTSTASKAGKLQPDVKTTEGYIEVGSLVTTSYSYTAEGWDLPNDNITTDILLRNLEELEEQEGPKNASSFDYISVYPEHTFVTLKVLNDRRLARLLAQNVPRADALANPCIANSNNPDDQVVKRLSCLARSRFAFVVAGVLEKVTCSPTPNQQCRDDGLSIYSTTVVFGKKGQLMARYRKFHMIDEPALDAAATQEAVVFTTDANLTFGIFTGQDLLFHEPAATFLNRSIQHYVHNGAWKNTLPFRLATSVELAWAETNRVFLLASGYMRPEMGYTGTGHYFSFTYISMRLSINSGGWFGREIYRRGPIQTYLSEENSKIQKTEEPLGILIESQDLKNWSTVPVPPSTQATTIKVCHGKTFCCELRYKTLDSSPNKYYQLIAFDGNRTDSQNKVLYPEQTCGLVACTGTSVLTCGAQVDDVIYTNQTYFSRELTLSGSFSSDKVLPVTVEGTGDYFPITTGLAFSIVKDGERFKATHDCVVLGELPKLRTFALVSSDFRIAKSGVSSVKFSYLISIVMPVLYKLYLS